MNHINTISKLILNFKDIYPCENTYDIILSFNLENNYFCHRPYTDGNINHNLQKPLFIVIKNTLNFKLLQGFLTSSLIYDFFEP